MKKEDYHIYPNPTVKQVIFQIQFSNLFMIENRIGDFQALIIEKFPESALNIRKHLIFADVGSSFKIDDLEFDENDKTRKIWEFKSEDMYKLNIQTNSLDISSVHHKSYFSKNGDGFRDIIEFSVNKFLEVIPIKMIKRMGLRYIDESPIPSLENQKFREWYNTSFPLNRFNLEDSLNMRVEVNTRKDDYYLIYREILEKKKEEFKLYLDYDGYTTNIKSDDYMETLDSLYEVVHNEWENNTIKQPVKDFMNQ